MKGARGLLINVTGGVDMSLYEVTEAASLIQEEAHEDANIIFGAVIDDEMGDEVRVTVIAAGFDRWESGTDAPRRGRASATSSSDSGASAAADVFGSADDDELEGDDDFDVPSFLK